MRRGLPSNPANDPARVGVRELRQNLSVYLDRVKAGETLTVTEHGFWYVALMLAAGPITAAPLLLFGAAATRIPLTTLGILQYVAPIMQFALGVLVYHEAMPPMRWAGFGLVWLALVIMTWDALSYRRRTVALAATAAATDLASETQFHGTVRTQLTSTNR